jgi:hypothetical protein
MDSLSRVTKSIKLLLGESEIKDVISVMKDGDMVQIDLQSEKSRIYKIIGIQGDNVLLKSFADSGTYYFNVNEYSDGKLIMHQKGSESTTLDVKNLTMGTPSGKTYKNIQPDGDGILVKPDWPKNTDGEPQEPESEEGMIDFDMPKKEPETEPENDADIESNTVKQELNAMNKIILSAKEGQNLHFTIDVSEEDEIDTSDGDNNLVLLISDINEKFIYCSLININGPISALLSKWLNGKNLVMKKEDLIKVKDGQMVLDVMDRKSKEIITIPNIDWVGVNQYENEPEEEGEGQQTLSQSELDDIMLANKPLANHWLSSPGAMAALAGASPSGRYTIAQQMKKLNLDTSYLTVGNKVEFVVKNDKRTGENGKDIEMNGTYNGVIAKGNKINFLGAPHQTHWEATLIDPDNSSNHQYKVKYKYFKNGYDGSTRGEGVIKITDIINKKNEKVAITNKKENK